jgi:hypothetical protein
MDREEELESLFKMDLDSSLRSIGQKGYGYDIWMDSNSLEEVIIVLFYTTMEGGIGRAASQIHI